jgi:predicted PurR-regulated permease PerM
MTELDNQPPKKESAGNSPRWGWTTKLIVGLVLAALGLILLVRFQEFIGPLLAAFIIAYLFYPLANGLRKFLHLRWRGSVFIIYVLFALILIGLIAWGGVALIEQVQNLITFIQNNINKLPGLIEEFSHRTFTIGLLEIDLTGLNWDSITSEIIGAIQPILGSAGSLVGKLVSGGANLIFWFFVTYLVSFFMLSETEGVQGRLMRIDIPSYHEDMERMGKELSRIWNAFIRGELIVVAAAIVIFTIFLGSMGVNYFFGLALVAGLGRFIPYIGAWISWISFGLVALLQPATPFGLSGGWYALIVVALALVIDNILDNILVPKVMGNALKVHPAAILIAALIGANLLGLIGVVLAAPVFASLQLLLRYVLAKMVDKDPWDRLEYREPPKQPRWLGFSKKFWKKIKAWFQKKFPGMFKKKVSSRSKTNPMEPEKD